MKKDYKLEEERKREEKAKELFKQHFPREAKIFKQTNEEADRDADSLLNSAVWSGFKTALDIIGETKSGFSLIEDSPDDLILYQKGKSILKVSLPEQSTQWNTELP